MSHRPPYQSLQKRTCCNYDYLFKVVVVGNSGVGKSALLNRYVDNNFSDKFIATLGVDFKIKSLKLNGKLIKLTIWDTAGQERFLSLTNRYYRGADGVFLVYDVTNGGSFENLKMWLNEVEINNSCCYLQANTNACPQCPPPYTEKVSNPDNQNDQNSNLAKVILGNKSDLRHKLAVPRILAEKFSQNNKMDFFEVSAKENQNVEEAFHKLVYKMIENNEHMKIMEKAMKARGVEMGISKGIEINVDKPLYMYDGDDFVTKSKGCC